MAGWFQRPLGLFELQSLQKHCIFPVKLRDRKSDWKPGGSCWCPCLRSAWICLYAVPSSTPTNSAATCYNVIRISSLPLSPSSICPSWGLGHLGLSWDVSRSDNPRHGKCHRKLNSQREHVLGAELRPRSAHLIAGSDNGIWSVSAFWSRAQKTENTLEKSISFAKGRQKDGAKQSPQP